MKSVIDGLTWAKGLESVSDGVAREVDVKEVKSKIDIDDVDPEHIRNGEVDAQKKEEFMNADKNIDVETSHDIVDGLESHHEASIVSGDEGGKVIEAMNVDVKSNAPKRFVISGFNAQTNPAAEPGDNLLSCVILLQNGVIPEVGVNGITAEDLLKVVEEVYVCFQEGQFACEENDEVLQGVRAAQAAIARRLARRDAQGTEGTYQGN